MKRIFLFILLSALMCSPAMGDFNALDSSKSLVKQADDVTITGGGQNILSRRPNGKLTYITTNVDRPAYPGMYRTDPTDYATIGSNVMADSPFNNSASWKTTSADWVVSGGVATCTAPSSASFIYQENIATIGAKYRVSVKVSSISGTGAISLTSGADSYTFTGPGTYVYDGIKEINNSVYIKCYAGSTMVIDDFTVKPITFNNSIYNNDDYYLGPELFTGNLNTGAGLSVSGEDATHIVTFSSSGMRYQSDTTSPQLVVNQLNTLTVGKNYLFKISGVVTSGSVKSDFFTPNTVDFNTITQKGAISTTFNITRSVTNVDVLITYISIREIIPKFKDTLPDGSRTHPYRMIQGTKVYDQYKSYTDTLGYHSKYKRVNYKNGWYEGSETGWSTAPWSYTPAATNLLTRSSGFENAPPWVISSGTVSADTHVSPTGAQDADTITATTPSAAFCSETVTGVTSGNPYTYSIFLRTVSGTGTWTLGWYDGAHHRTDVSVTEKWQRYTISFTPSATSINVYCMDTRGLTCSLTSVVAWGAQLETGSTATPPITTTTAAVTTVGTAFNYVKYSTAPTTANGWLVYYVEEPVATTEVSGPIPGRDARKIVAKVNSSSHFVACDNSASFTSGSVYTQTALLKAGEISKAQLTFASAAFGSNAWATFDLREGKVVSYGSAASGEIEYVNNGWYRCSITSPATVTTTTYSAYIVACNDNNYNSRFPSYTGDGVSGFYLAHVQIELSNYFNGYVITDASAVTTAVIPSKLKYGGFYSPSAGGILCEPAATNLFVYGSDMTNAAWTKSTMNVDQVYDSYIERVVSRLTATVGTGAHAVTGTVVMPTPHTRSVVIRSNGVQYVQMNSPSAFNGTAYANYDIINGTVTASTDCTASISPIGNHGWYVITYTVSGTASTAGCSLYFVDTGTTARGGTYTGDGVKGAYVAFSQAESGSYATSPIITTTSTATRALTIITVDKLIPNSGDNFTLILRQKSSGSQIASNQCLFDTWTGSLEDRYIVQILSATYICYIADAGISNNISLTYSYAASEDVFIVFKVSTNENLKKLWVGGVYNSLSDTQHFVPQTSCRLGSYYNNSNPYNGIISAVIINRALSDANCLAISNKTKTIEEALRGN